jgi:hypothetical protein
MSDHECDEGSEQEVGIVYFPADKRWEFYHPERREAIKFCPYCGRKLDIESKPEDWIPGFYTTGGT